MDSHRSKGKGPELGATFIDYSQYPLPSDGVPPSFSPVSRGTGTSISGAAAFTGHTTDPHFPRAPPSTTLPLASTSTINPSTYYHSSTAIMDDPQGPGQSSGGGPSRGSTTTTGHGDGDGADGVKKRRKSSVGDNDGLQRVQLACFYCRTKRIRCSGERPICSACIKANVKCEWPSGRRKKRTRKEMEEARKQDAMAQAGETMTEDDGQSLPDQSATIDPNDLWSLPSVFDQNNAGPSNYGGSSNYGWPSGFTTASTSAINPAQFPFTPFGGSGSSISPVTQTHTDGTANSAANFFADFMGGIGTSPGTDMKLVQALENQAAYIEGNPAEDKDLELFYYRFSGSTAIHPGINRISLKLQRRTANSPIAAAPQPEQDESGAPSPAKVNAEDLFEESGMPLTHVWQPLFDLYFKHMSQHFPSISRQRMDERFESGTMSQFLANCICALGARFQADVHPANASAPFIAKAQELCIPLLHLPTTDAATGLLLLSWANYGQGSDSGLWQYSGMAIRMAIDVGVHQISDIYESQAHVVRTRLLFWSLFITDRIVAFATGRPASIPEDIVEVPLPEDADFFPDPARNRPSDPLEIVEPVPFVYLVKLIIICGRISNVLNGRRGRVRTLVQTTEPLQEQLAELQMRLVQFVAGLPETLKWSVENFKHQQNRGHGGTFLELHLWAHAVLALVYHPELLKSPSGIETPLNQGMSRNVKLSLASSRLICECMVFADLVSQDSYISCPFVVQPLYVAAMALIHEMRNAQANESSGNATDMFLVSIARQNFTALFNAMVKLEGYWAGASDVANLLEKRAFLLLLPPALPPPLHPSLRLRWNHRQPADRSLAGSGFTRSRPKKSHKKVFISLPDRGILQRFATDPNHPQNVAPATDTSLQHSIVKQLGPSPYWLSDLMAGYTVENMSFQPADSFDLERLLAGTQGVVQGGPQ